MVCPLSFFFIHQVFFHQVFFHQVVFTRWFHQPYINFFGMCKYLPLFRMIINIGMGEIFCNYINIYMYICVIILFLDILAKKN